MGELCFRRTERRTKRRRGIYGRDVSDEVVSLSICLNVYYGVSKSLLVSLLSDSHVQYTIVVDEARAGDGNVT